MVSLLIADDQHVMRLGLSTFLSQERDIDVVGLAASGREAVSLCRTLRPDVVLMDVRMPDGNGLEATRALLAPGLAYRPKIIVITTFDVDQYMFTALDIGASGFFLKDADPADLANAVRTVAAGGCVVAPDLSPRLFSEFSRRRGRRPVSSDHPLTAREIQVVKLLARGAGNREVSNALGLALSTVKAHVSKICTKLELQSRVQIVIWAFTSGIITLDEASSTVDYDNWQEPA